ALRRPTPYGNRRTMPGTMSRRVHTSTPLQAFPSLQSASVTQVVGAHATGTRENAPTRRPTAALRSRYRPRLSGYFPGQRDETIGKTQHQRALSTSDAKDLSRWRHDARTGGSGPLAPDRQGE